MSSEEASNKKISGMINEIDFAQIIGGEVNAGSQTDKKDVIDKQHNSHSVKGGKYWQIFLYSRSRLASNTIFRGMGSLADLLIGCIDAFPAEYTDYIDNKKPAKIQLQPAMRAVQSELSTPHILAAFFSKALFNGGEVKYLSVLHPDISSGNCGVAAKHFYIFHQDDVVEVLVKTLAVKNSKARNKNQYDDQKVIFWCGRNVGELELRTDSELHYRQLKCRFNAKLVLAILQANLGAGKQLGDQLTAYGRAIRGFKLL